MDSTYQSETLYSVPLELVYGKHEELGEVPPREKSCISGAYLGKGGTLTLSARSGISKSKIAAELGIDVKFIELCY